MIRDGCYGPEDEKGNFINGVKMPKLKEIQIDIDTHRSIMIFDVDYGGLRYELKIPREDTVSRQKLLSHASEGLDVRESTVSWLMEEICIAERNLHPNRIKRIHNNLGWTFEGNQFIFKKFRNTYLNTVSSYAGSLLIQPQGSWDVYKAMLKKYILQSPPLTFAFIAGLSAVVNGLSERFCDGESVIVHFSGGSSTGKTTAVTLAISTAGEPNLAKCSLLQSWGATMNAILGSVVGNFGFPIAFDEASAINLKDFSKLIYSLCSGKEKARLNQDFNLIEQRGFRTTILSTGEKSLLANCNGNGGLNVRVIEVDNVQLTKSAEEAEEIKDICQNNNGIALDMFSEYLVRKLNGGENFMEKMLKVHDEYRKKFAAACQSNQFTSRLAKKYALFMATAKVARSALKLDIDMDALFNFITDIDTANNLAYSRDIAQEFMEKLMSFVASNQSSFTKTTSPGCFGRCLGRLEYHKGSKTLSKIIISKEDFEYILRSVFKFEDVGVVVNALKLKGLLLPDKDGHNTRKATINSEVGPVRCYIIAPKVDADDEQVETSIGDNFHDYDNLI